MRRQKHVHLLRSLRRAEFDTEAEERYTRIVESGRTIPWSEMRLP